MCLFTYRRVQTNQKYVMSHRSPKLKISLLIRNTIISDKTNIREFVWEIVFRTICHWNKEISNVFVVLTCLVCVNMSPCGIWSHSVRRLLTEISITDRMAPYSTRRQIDIHETSKCNKNVRNFLISVTYCSKDNLSYKLSYIRLITYYGNRQKQCSLWVVHAVKLVEKWWNANCRKQK